MASRTAGASPQQRALPAHVMESPLLTSKRGHARSSSLENANSFLSKNTLGVPIMQPATAAGHTGTLKSRNEQKRMRTKYGSHNNLDDYVGQPSLQQQLQFQQQHQHQQQQHQQQQQKQGRLRFQNIRQFFEISRANGPTNSVKQKSPMQAQSIPSLMTQSETAATLSTLLTTSYNNISNNSNIGNHHQQQQTRLPQQQGVSQCKNMGLYNQQQQQQQQQQQPAVSPRRPMPTKHATGSGNRGSIASDQTTIAIAPMSGEQHLSMSMHESQNNQQQQHNQQQQAHMKIQQAHPQTQQPHQSHQPHQQRQESFNGVGSTQNLRSSATATTPDQSASNILRPIAFKPIPFEPDYSIPTRYGDGPVSAVSGPSIGDRFGSTPSLAAAQGSNLRFGSTTDLRNNNNNNGGGGSNSNSNNNSNGNHSVGVTGVSGIGGGGGSSNGMGLAMGMAIGGGGGSVAGYSSNNYCNSLMARRRGSRSLKINDSMESIRHTPDSDVQSQSSTIKSNCTAMNGNNNQCSSSSSSSNSNSIVVGSNNNKNSNSNSNNKYMLSEQCDMTPSPSDSGISDLEAALKDRDSELSYLRQTMEHNEKDKEAFWENETKRLKAFYEEQQRDYLLKMKKLEQMLVMHQFQFKQHKHRHTEHANKLREQVSDLKNENEILKSNNTSLKNSERNLKDRLAYVEEQLNGTQDAVSSLKGQLEECEWRVCERNGELALLKSQLKEANVEITLKEHAIVHLRQENTQAENQIYQSLQENHQKISQHRQNEAQNAAESQLATENELKQMNKIIILKDQVILALTNELAKLRKELSDLAISHEYGEEPSGKFTRLKQQLDSLSDIYNRKRMQDPFHPPSSKAKVIDDTNLEVIMNCLKIAPSMSSEESSDDERSLDKLSAEKRLAKMSADIQNFVYGSQNLPDVAVSVRSEKSKATTTTGKIEEATLDTLIEESANYAEEIGKLRRQLDDVRVNFELEKRQWIEEREKVLRYQKQLQTHYINMYQKLRSLENSAE